MPEMTLQEEESEIEMGIRQPGTSSVRITWECRSISEIRGESEVQLQRSTIQFDRVDRRILRTPNSGHKPHQRYARK